MSHRVSIGKRTTPISMRQSTAREDGGPRRSKLLEAGNRSTLAFAEFGEVTFNTKTGPSDCMCYISVDGALDMIPFRRAVAECSVSWPFVGPWTVERD
jgi:hypothetical protein